MLTLMSLFIYVCVTFSFVILCTGRKPDVWVMIFVGFTMAFMTTKAHEDQSKRVFSIKTAAADVPWMIRLGLAFFGIVIKLGILKPFNLSFEEIHMAALNHKQVKVTIYLPLL